MKYKILFFTLFILISAHSVYTQELKGKLRFGVWDESGNFFKDLKASDIQVSGLQNLSLNLSSDQPLELMIMIDVSASQEKMLPSEKKAAQIFIRDFLKTERDKVAVVSFSGSVLLRQDLTADLRKAQAEIEKIEFIPPKGYVGGGIVVSQTPPLRNQTIVGSTSMWDSLKQVAEAFAKVPETGAQRAVLLISDGVNTYGETKLDEVVETLMKTKIPVYAIGIGDKLYSGVDTKTLKKITHKTGGISIVPKNNLENLTGLLETMARALRSSYELSYTVNPSASKASLQEIKIEIVAPELRKRKLEIVQPESIYVKN